MSEKQPEALRLAGLAASAMTLEYERTDDWIESAAAKLRQQHALIEQMREALVCAKVLAEARAIHYQSANELDSFHPADAAVINAANAALSAAEAQQ